jgi:hypothetical protein
MIRSWSLECWAAFALSVVTFLPACHPAVDAPGVPLYPSAETARLPRNQIAQVTGPIAKIDGQDVVDQGGRFDLLPGCHLVELDRRVTGDSYTLSSATYWTGQFARTTYAMRMKPGARYVIRRVLDSSGFARGRVILSAREEEANGAMNDLLPARSAEEIQACR